MSRATRRGAPAVGSLFPGLDVVAPEAPMAKPRTTLADRLLADVHAERAEGAAQAMAATAPGLGRLTLADLAAEAGKKAAQVAAAAASGPCSAVACSERREAKYYFCGTHQAGLPHGAQTREFDARERGPEAHAAALAICVRLLATAEGRLVLRPGERAPWADAPEVAARIERTLTEAGLRREESTKHGAAWYLDVPRYETAGRGEQRASAYASLYADTRQRISWLSSDPGKVRLIRPSEIADEAVRARVQAAEKSGAGNGSHVSLGPLLGAEVDAAFRAMIAAALKRHGDQMAAEAARVAPAEADEDGGDDGGEPGRGGTDDSDRYGDRRGGDCGTDPGSKEGGGGDDLQKRGAGGVHPRDAVVLGRDARDGTTPSAGPDDRGDPLDAAAERLMLAVLRGLERGQAEASDRRAEFLAFSAELPTVAAEPDVDTGRPDAWGTRVSWHLELPKGVRCGDGGKGGRAKERAA